VKNLGHQVLSPSEDILHRLAPTLPAPHTCDIIDINPGTCLWSQKLHEVLQPRRHVLVESQPTNFSKYLSPLLDPPASRYRHAHTVQEALDREKGLLSAEITQDQKSLDELGRFNHSLLLTVNLAGSLAKSTGYEGVQSSFFFNDLYASLFGLRNNIHRYGLVRALVWLPDGEKDSYLPRTVSLRTKQSVILEASSLIQEVAGSPSSQGAGIWARNRRFFDLDQENASAVAATQAAAGIATPEDRRDTPPAPPLPSIKPDPDTLRMRHFSTDPPWVSEFLAVDEHLRTKDAEWYHTFRHRIQERRRPYQDTPERKLWRDLMTRARSVHHRYVKMVDLIQRQREIDRQWRQISIATTGSTAPSELIAKLKHDGEKLNEEIEKLSKDFRIFVRKSVDDYRAHDAHPPVLAWNRRKAEPWIVSAEEFVPSGRQLALLDVVPRPEFPTLLDTQSKRICFDHVLRQLSVHFGSSVHDALKIIVPAGLEEFIDTVPDLKNPAKGGWHDLTDFRLRCLPASLIIEVALAFERWPFRPSVESMLMMTPDRNQEYEPGDND